jgi:hypothetical protein
VGYIRSDVVVTTLVDAKRNRETVTREGSTIGKRLFALKLLLQLAQPIVYIGEGMYLQREGMLHHALKCLWR